MSSRLPRSVWIPVLALALVVFGWRINTIPFTNWDEGIYANVNLELFHSQDWTKLTYFGADFLEKPPLQFWATSFLFGVFGPTELAVRLIPVLAGIATSLLLALWVWQRTKHRAASVITGVVFILGRFALLHAFRTGDLDGLLVLFITLALYGYWRSWTSARWIVVWGAASAGAIMTKSFVGLLPLMIVGIDMLVSRGWRRIGWTNIGWAMFAFVALAAPWHIIETLRFGQAFWHSYLGVNVLERTTDSLFTTTPWWWYAQIIRDRLYPFSFLLPVVLMFAGWRMWKKDELMRLLLIWTVVTFIAFTYIHTRREWYILPLYPALAMILGFAALDWWYNKQKLGLQFVIVLSTSAALGHVLTDTQIRLALEHFPLVKNLTTSFWRTISGQILFGLAIGTLLIMLSVVISRRRSTWWRWWLGLSGGVFVLIALSWTALYLRTLPTSLPLKTMATVIEEQHVQSVSLIGTRLKKQPAGYFYILRMGTHSMEYAPGTLPKTPLVVTTNEDKNKPLNTEGKKLVNIPPLLLLDLR